MKRTAKGWQGCSEVACKVVIMMTRMKMMMMKMLMMMMMMMMQEARREVQGLQFLQTGGRRKLPLPNIFRFCL